MSVGDRREFQGRRRRAVYRDHCGLKGAQLVPVDALEIGGSAELGAGLVRWPCPEFEEPVAGHAAASPAPSGYQASSTA
mgnify:CR=1 FL=1